MDIKIRELYFSFFCEYEFSYFPKVLTMAIQSFNLHNCTMWKVYVFLVFFFSVEEASQNGYVAYNHLASKGQS